MSRTLKTRPLDVRMLDEREHGIEVKEVHYHETGECNLPEKDLHQILETIKDPDFDFTKNCHYEVDGVALPHHPAVQKAHLFEKRGQRRKLHQELHAIKEQCNAGEDLEEINTL